MAIINVKKNKLINAAESRLLNIFHVKNFCLTIELWLIHPSFIWSRPRVYIKYDQKSCSNFSSNKIDNFVECVVIESCFINKRNFLVGKN